MKKIHTWAKATFILCFLVIIAGGIVRTTQSGMGCPDWPKCFGKWIPPTNVSELPADFEKYLRKQDIDHTFNPYHTWIEYFNRLFGVLLGFFAIIQVVLLFKKRDQQRKPYRLAIWFLVTVILTGLFGAMVVKLNLAHVSISVHLFFALLLVQIQMALLLSLSGKISWILINKKIQKWLLAFLLVLIIHSALGTMVRIYVDDISKQLNYGQREAWLAKIPFAFIIHRTFSWVVLAFAFYIMWLFKDKPSTRNKIFFLLAIVIANMIAGIVLYYADMPAIAQPIHLLLATIAITQTVNVLLQLKPVKSVI
ncbi:MAG: COX15/CtaA family protein [Bacteroidota bacterium]